MTLTTRPGKTVKNDQSLIVVSPIRSTSVMYSKKAHFLIYGEVFCRHVKSKLVRSYQYYGWETERGTKGVP